MRHHPIAFHAPALAAAVCLLATGCFLNDDDDDGATGEAQGSWAKLEMDGIPAMMDVYVTTGPGYTIERIQGFNGAGRPDDRPGRATENQFVFEMGDSAPGTADLKAYFDAYTASGGTAGSRNAAMIVLRNDNSEAFRWILASFAPAVAYQAVSGGRTRFTLTCTLAMDSQLGWDFGGDDPFGSGGAYNPAADRMVEMDGLASAFFPMVEDNASTRTLTFTFDYQEGRGIFDWVQATIQGVDTVVNLSVIQLDASFNQVSRWNYEGCFPIAYEQHTGYDLDTKIKARVVVSYNRSQDASP